MFYVKVTSDYIHSPAYFAGHVLSKIKEEAHFSLTDLPLSFEEISIEEIPKSSRVHSVGLSREDSRALMLKFDN